jgi:uncharacterized protein with von Willebrand factor type A (vWA) domain
LLNSFRYFKWDGTEPFEFDKDRLMDELSRRMMADGNLSRALWEMQNMGMADVQGRQLPSLQDLLLRLQEKKQSQLNRYNLDSVMDDIRKALEDVVKTERAGIEKQLADLRQRAHSDSPDLSPEMRRKLLNSAEDKFTHNLEKLNNLPQDIGGQVKELNQYDFMDGDARRKFQELLKCLRSALWTLMLVSWVKP